MIKTLTRQTIGVGVAGTGFIGPAHVEGLRRNGIQVLGLVEQNKEMAQQKAAELGITRYYATLDEMLADPDAARILSSGLAVVSHRLELAFGARPGRHVAGRW